MTGERRTKEEGVGEGTKGKGVRTEFWCNRCKVDDLDETEKADKFEVS